MITFAIGLDLAIVIGLAGGVLAPESIPWYLAMSPTSVYRGLVLTYVVGPAVTTAVDPAYSPDKLGKPPAMGFALVGD